MIIYRVTFFLVGLISIGEDFFDFGNIGGLMPFARIMGWVHNLRLALGSFYAGLIMAEGKNLVFLTFQVKIDAVVKFTRLAELYAFYNVGFASLGRLYSK